MDIKELASVIKSLKEENKSLMQNIFELKMPVEDVRNELYNNGFYLNYYKKDRDTKEYKIDQTIKYVFWFRSPSKSKVGDVYFINKKLYQEINQWQSMGIVLPEKKCKLVEYEAYKALTSSAIENTVTINPLTEMLIVNDLDSLIEQECNIVHMNNDKCDVKKEITKVKSTIWDGMALLDNSLFFDNENDVSFKVLRQHFFKACGFRSYLTRFFKDYYKDEYDTATIIDRYERKVLVKNIKCITTENALKWVKLRGDKVEDYKYWCDKVNSDNNIFGVCKIDHDSKYGQYQRMSYQFINSMPINQEESINLCNESISFVELLKTDDDKFLKFLEMTASDINANDMFIDLYKHNPYIKSMEFFRKFRVKTISEYKETLRAGKLLTNANNLTVCGNPYALLLYVVGKLDEYINDNIISNYIDSTLPIISSGVSCYTSRFNDGECLAGFRSPHNSPNNILYLKNNKDSVINKYFKLNDNCIAVNMIGTDVQARANGMDEDSDFLYCTNQKICVQAAKEAQKYLTIVNDIPFRTNPYDNTMSHLAAIDNKLASSRFSIGESSNLAQLALSWYWYNKYNNKDDKELKQIELEKVFITCSIIAQVSIDSSKREYRMNVGEEITKLKKLSCLKLKIDKDKKIASNDKSNADKLLSAKPYYWKYIKEFALKEKRTNDNSTDNKVQIKQKAMEKQNTSNNNLINKCTVEKVCPMDWIQLGIDNIKSNHTNKSYIDDILFIEAVSGKADQRKIDRIKKIIKELDDMYKKHYDEKESDDEKWLSEEMIKTEETLYKLKKIKNLDMKTMQILIISTLSDKGANKKYKRRLLKCLYKTHANTFISVFITEKKYQNAEYKNQKVS